MRLIKKSSIFLSLLLPLTSVNAALVVLHDRASWLDEVGSSNADWIEDFNQSEQMRYDKVSTLAQSQTTYLDLSVTGGSGDSTWRIDHPQDKNGKPRGAFPNISPVELNPYAILVSKDTNTVDGNTRIEFDPLRAIGFEYSGAAYSSKDGRLTTSLGDTVNIDKQPQGVFFLGLVYTEGESFDALTLSFDEKFTRGRFAMGIDNVEGFSAPVFSADADLALKAPNPVPLPAAGWLFVTALIGLVGLGRRKTQVRA